MNNRNGLIAASVIAVLAIIFALIQSGNVSQSEGKLSAMQSTATAQQAVITDEWVKGQATLSAANTQAADTQQKAVSDAATAQASAVADAKNAAATAQAKALGDAANVASTMQAQVLAAASEAAATEEANARKEVANAAATAQASAIADTKNTAATAQAKAFGEQKNAAATQKADSIATLQAGATATLGAALNAAATTQAGAVADTLNAGATAQAQAIMTVQAQATATMSAMVIQAATDRADMQTQYQVTSVAVETEIARINAQLATAQAIATNAVKPTAVPTSEATAISTTNPIPEATLEATEAVSGVPAGWKRYVGKGVAIQLPKTYLGTELGSDPAALAKILRALGPDFESAAALMESNPEILSFIAVDQGDGDKNPAASVIIVSVPLPTTIPIDALLEATINQLPSGSKILEKSVVQFQGHDAGRMIVETHVGTIISTQLQYYIIANNILYLVGFTGAPAHFNEQIPSFEQSMKTFEILAKPGI